MAFDFFKRNPKKRSYEITSSNVPQGAITLTNQDYSVTTSYKSVSKTSKRGFNQGGHSVLPRIRFNDDPNYDFKTGLKKVRDSARYLCRFDPVARKALFLHRINVIGRTGIQLDCTVKEADGKTLNKKVNNEVEKEFKNWSKYKVCEVTGKFSFKGVQQQIANYLFREGEIFIRHLDGFDNEYGYAIELIDPSRVPQDMNKPPSNGRQVIAGIEVDEWGRKRALYVRSDFGDYSHGNEKYKRIDFDNIEHVYNPEFADSLRGTSNFLAVAEKLRNLTGYDTAELVRARASAGNAGFFARKDEQTYTPDTSHSGDELDEVSEREENIGLPTSHSPGMYFELPRGYEFISSDSNAPNPIYMDYEKAQKRGGFSVLNVSYNEGSEDYEGVNYTSLRAAALSNREGYREVQDLIIEKACDEIYQRWLRMARLKGRFKYVNSRNIEQVKEATFMPRTWDWVDPLKDAAALIALMDKGIISPKEVVKTRSNKDIEDVYDEIQYCQELREERGILLKDENPLTLEKIKEFYDEDEEENKIEKKSRSGAISNIGGVDATT